MQFRKLPPSLSLFVFALGAVSLRCSPAASPVAHFAEPGAACDAGQRELIALVQRSPERASTASTQAALPEAALGDVPGEGPVLELRPDGASWASVALPGSTPNERAEALAARLSTPVEKDAAVYVAAAPELDVQTLRTYLQRFPASTVLRLLVRIPSAATEASSGSTYATRLLDQRDPRAREAIAGEGYATHSRCPGLQQAVAQLNGLGPSERWPELRRALARTLPACSCNQLDSSGLKSLIVAEQRAGTASLGWLPLSFVRDVRCGTSMPLRSVGKLVGQIEQFNTEFSGRFQSDALTFDQVLTNQRLLEYFCNPLPGETLTALGRGRANVYFRTATDATCQAWRIEALSPGAPMGTLRLLRGGQPTQVSFHYWQGAEELRLFGPASVAPASLPTDTRSWACDESARLTGVDSNSLQFEKGRWFFDEATCRAAPAEAAIAGCVVPHVSNEAAPAAKP